MLSRLDTMQKNGKMKILDSCIRKSSALEKKMNRLRKQSDSLSRGTTKSDHLKRIKRLKLSALERSFTAERERLLKENERLQAQLRENQTMLAGMEERKADKAESDRKRI